MKAEDLRTLDAEELTSRLKGARRELYELRFKIAVGQLDDHRQIRKVRKDIARILTIVHARRLGEAIEPVEGEIVVEPEDTGADAVAAAAIGEGAAEPAAEPAIEEAPENVETVVEAEPAQAPASRKSRRRRGAGEEGE